VATHPLATTGAVMTDTAVLKFYILNTIGCCVDEVSLSLQNGDERGSFCEMDQGVFHVSFDGENRYFKVELTETTEDHYFDRLISDEVYEKLHGEKFA
jgi:uncharacterized protein YkuJ